MADYLTKGCILIFCFIVIVFLSLISFGCTQAIEFPEESNTKSEASTETTFSNTEESETEDYDSSYEDINNLSKYEVELQFDIQEIGFSINSGLAIASDFEGSVFYEKFSDNLCYPASLTKLLTISTAYRYMKEGQLFEVGDEIDLVLPGSSTAYLKKGDILDFEAITAALLLPSGNDAAYVIAKTIGMAQSKKPNTTSEEAIDLFVELMNDMAKEIGCENSSFLNPDGYHDGNHFTTPKDMLKIALYSLKLDFVREISGRTKSRHVFVNGRDVTWFNTNLLLKEDGEFYYPYADGLKTGMTNNAGRCLAATSTKDNQTVIVLLFKAEKDKHRFEDAAKIMDYKLFTD